MLGYRTGNYIYLAVFAIGLAITLLILYGKPDPQPRQRFKAAVVQVDIAEIKAGTHQLWINSQGVLEPKVQIDLVAEVSGRVMRIADVFAVGNFFSTGQSLLEVDPSDYEIAISQARSTLASTRQILAQEKGAARQARREWRDLGDAEANELFLRKPQLRAAEAAVRAAEAGLRKAELDLQRTRISVPFNGQILRKHVDIGQYIMAGTTVAEVFSSDRGEMRLPLSPRQRQQLSTGNMPAQLFARYGDREYQWPAVVDRIEAEVDRESRQHYAIVSVDTPFEQTQTEAGVRPALAVGQFLRARIAGEQIAGSYLIPRQALRQARQIWVVDSESRLRLLPVDIIQSDNSSALVKVHDKNIAGQPLVIVVSDLAHAADGIPVDIRNSNRWPDTQREALQDPLLSSQLNSQSDTGQ